MMSKHIRYIVYVGLLILFSVVVIFCCCREMPQETRTGGSEPKIEIYNVYHKKSRIFQNDVVIPIHAGRALHTPQGQKLEDLMIGDDTGDNISALNDRYSELTALYWIWKNSTADYVGLMHYRRRLFLANYRDNEACGFDYMCFLGFTKENIMRIMQKYDIVAAHSLPMDGKNIYDHYAYCHYSSDFDAALDYIRANYPEMRSYVDKWVKNEAYYPFNMFIMKKELLDEYAAFLFDVLFGIDDKINVNHYLTDKTPRAFPTNYSYQKRSPGFLAERLFDLWVGYHNYKVKTVRVEYGTEYNPMYIRDRKK